MPTTIDSAGITFNDASAITSANTFIAKPASPSNGQVLGYDGSTWTGTSLSASPTSAKAWVNFDGFPTTGTSTISASYNVSSVTINGTGLFSVNFATNMSNNKYVVVGNASLSQSSNNNCQVTIHSQNQAGSNAFRNPTASSFFISVVNNNGANDRAYAVNVCVFN